MLPLLFSLKQSNLHTFSQNKSPKCTLLDTAAVPAAISFQYLMLQLTPRLFLLIHDCCSTTPRSLLPVMDLKSRPRVGTITRMKTYYSTTVHYSQHHMRQADDFQNANTVAEHCGLGREFPFSAHLSQFDYTMHNIIMKTQFKPSAYLWKCTSLRGQ